MPIPDAPEPAGYEEARDFLAGLTALPAEEVRGLEVSARAQAFWISHATEMSLVQDVLEQVGAHLVAEDADPWADFQEVLLERLERDWAGKVGDPPRRLELITRNLGQRAYNTGRFQQMHSPGAFTARPYGIFDAVGDARTSEICLHQSGTILPLNDPYWDSHWPPLHHYCRSIVRSLSFEEAVDRGISPAAPVEDADTAPSRGFGSSPRRAGIWQPNRDDYDPRVWDAAVERGLELGP